MPAAVGWRAWPEGEGGVPAIPREGTYLEAGQHLCFAHRNIFLPLEFPSSPWILSERRFPSQGRQFECLLLKNLEAQCENS